MVYYIIILKVPDRYSTHILPLLKYTHQYPCLYRLVIITHYLINKSGGINCKL